MTKSFLRGFTSMLCFWYQDSSSFNCKTKLCEGCEPLDTNEFIANFRTSLLCSSFSCRGAQKLLHVGHLFSLLLTKQRFVSYQYFSLNLDEDVKYFNCLFQTCLLKSCCYQRMNLDLTNLTLICCFCYCLLYVFFWLYVPVKIKFLRFNRLDCPLTSLFQSLNY